jgi:hypothetical protein
MIFQDGAVGRKRLRDSLLGVVKVVEIAAEPHRVRLDQDRRTTSKVAVKRPVLREKPGKTRLEIG